MAALPLPLLRLLEVDEVMEVVLLLRLALPAAGLEFVVRPGMVLTEARLVLLTLLFMWELLLLLLYTGKLIDWLLLLLGTFTGFVETVACGLATVLFSFLAPKTTTKRMFNTFKIKDVKLGFVVK